jgi:hypothetical protein
MPGESRPAPPWPPAGRPRPQGSEFRCRRGRTAWCRNRRRNRAPRAASPSAHPAARRYRRPTPPADVVEQRPRRVRGVGRMDPAPRQLPDQEAVDRAEQKLAPFGPRPRAFDMVQQPLHLGAREIGVQQQACPVGHHRLVALVLQALAQVGGAAVLPDDGVVDWLAGVTVPDQHRLALVGDADGGDLAGGNPGPFDHAPRGPRDRGPEVGRIMLYPAGLRENLRKFFLRHRDHAQGRVEQDRPGRGGALVDGKDMRRHVGS